MFDSCRIGRELVEGCTKITGVERCAVDYEFIFVGDDLFDTKNLVAVYEREKFLKYTKDSFGSITNPGLRIYSLSGTIWGDEIVLYLS